MHNSSKMWYLWIFFLPKFTAGVVTGSATVSAVYSGHEERMLGIMRTSQSQLEQPELTLNPGGGAAFYFI